MGDCCRSRFCTMRGRRVEATVKGERAAGEGKGSVREE